MNKFMNEACEEAKKAFLNKTGGPFGSVVVKESKIIGRGHNCVLKHNDPTLHGEIMAIKEACKSLNSHDLSGCTLYSTAEPCIMCLGACLWANIDKVYYGCNINDTEKIGFRDKKFYNFSRSDYFKELDREECLKLFNEFDNMDKELY